MSSTTLRALIIINLSILSGCAQNRQLTIDRPESNLQTFSAPTGFQGIDGDDFYIRFVSEFSVLGDNLLKDDCSKLNSYQKGDLSAALVYRLHNDLVKYQSEATGFFYQAATGTCDYAFDAKKLNLTPWLRLDNGKETQIDYDFYTNANSELDISALVRDVNAASGVLALTGAGLSVAIMGQMASQWLQNKDSQPAPQSKPTPKKHRSQSHSLPTLTAYSENEGQLKQVTFGIKQIDEGGMFSFGNKVKILGDLKVYPEITASLLLRPGANGIPDARDTSLEELNQSPIRSNTGDISLSQLIDQSQEKDKPNTSPNWKNYDEVQNNCHKLKLRLKALGFNKFDRNAVLYYFLAGSDDWKNYNISRGEAIESNLRSKTITAYRKKSFSGCLAENDFQVMKAMGLKVNTVADWEQLGVSSQQRDQLYSPLQSIERQLLPALRNSSSAEMERQLYPLLMTADKKEGMVLLQNHLGEFGLEKLLDLQTAPAGPTPADASLPPAPAAPVYAPIPGEGTVVSAKQIANALAGLKIAELSCVRPAPGMPGKNIGLLLFTTQNDSPWAKGGALEFEFRENKINRIAFQSPSYRDFEQDILDRPEIGSCRIEPAWLQKLH